MTDQQEIITLDITESAKIAKRVLSHAFPSVKFSVRKESGYSVRVEWTDGPTVQQVKATLEPIRAGHNLNRDSMTDYAGYVTKTPVLFEGKLTQFTYGGYDGLPSFVRNIATATKEAVIIEVATRMGYSPDEIDPTAPNWHEYRHVWHAIHKTIDERDFTPARAVAPSGNPQPSQPADSAGAVSWELSKKGNAPGWFWFSGDTKPIKEDLKAHGCRWSSKRSQWYFMTTSEAPDVLPPALVEFLQGGQPSQPVRTNPPTPTESVVSSVPTAKTPTTPADKFRRSADALTAQIDKALAPRAENTHKRARQAEHARQDGWNMQALQTALRALADGWDNDTLTPLQRRITTKKQLELILYHHRYFTHPYHNPREDGRIDPVQDMETIQRDYNYQVKEGALFACNSFDEYWQLVLEVADMAKGGSYDSKAASIASKQQALALTKTESYFPTPPDLVKRMLHEADIQPSDKILEPSAGAGHIADLIRSEYPNNTLQCVEVWGKAVEVLQLKGHAVEQTDFLQYESSGWNKIIMNPPFNNLADIDHVQHAYSLLAEGGRIVAIMGNGFTFRQDKKTAAFRQWLETVGAYADLPADTFKASDRPTGVKTCLVVIDKPEAQPAPQPQPEKEDTPTIIQPTLF